MAPWNAEKFRRLENVLIATMEGKRPVIDVPYYIYLYDPAEELRALEEFENLERRLRTKGFSVEIIWMPDLMMSALKRFGFLGSDILSVESSQRARVKSDLERILPENTAFQLRDKLKGRGVDHCAIFLRCGALYPFAHVSTLLSSLEGYVNCTIVIGYPGDREGQMLNEKGENVRSYYRAEII